MNVECLLRDSMKTKPKSNRGARQKTSTPKNVTRMNYNENPYGMSDEVKSSYGCFPQQLYVSGFLCSRSQKTAG